MKVILSRKGFDSSYGGYPSPIFPNRKMISLPIPSDKDLINYNNLKFGHNKNYYHLMKNLKSKILNKKWRDLNTNTKCHLDPDIYKGIYPRDLNWKPMFGQMNAAAKHLDKQEVGDDDLFLFYGWFRPIKEINSKFQMTNGPDLHIIFGYLQIREKFHPTSNNILNWMKYHPHTAQFRINEKSNRIYIAREYLSWDSNIAGAGIFDFNENLVLTKKGLNRTQWDLPKFFRDVAISYHPKESKKYGWKDGFFQSATRGQEFVIQDNENVEKWAKDLINKKS